MTQRTLRLVVVAAIVLSALFTIGVISITRLLIDRPSPSVSTLRDAKLQFDDEFDGSSLDTSNWSTCYDWYSELARGCSNYGNYERQWYTPSGVSVSGGILTLTARQEPVLGVDGSGNPLVYPYRSGMVSTGAGGTVKPKRLNRYGYYEARIMNPDGKGIWPAFWLLPQGKTWPPEIDIMEQTGDKPKDLLMTYFWPNNETVSSKDSYTFTGKSSYARSWHTYGLLWTKDSLTWYVDGIERHHIEGPNVPDKPMILMLNLAVGGTLPGDPDPSTKFPSSMKVDYVRIYSVDR